MALPTLGERTLTELDHVRLAALLRRGATSPAVAALVDEADLVPSREVAPDVVTMYSQVLVADAGADARRKLAGVLPRRR